MRKYEMKVCRRCKKMYRWSSGGIVPTPEDQADRGLCGECRRKVCKVQDLAKEGGRKLK